MQGKLGDLPVNLLPLWLGSIANYIPIVKLLTFMSILITEQALDTLQPKPYQCLSEQMSRPSDYQVANILGMTRKKETDWLHTTYVPKLEEEVLWMCARL